jgi:hypothetical protein
MMALGAAEQTLAVSSVVAYEPAVFDEIDEETFADFTGTLARMTEEVEQGRPAEAARLFSAFVCTDEELTAVVAHKRSRGRGSEHRRRSPHVRQPRPSRPQSHRPRPARDHHGAGPGPSGRAHSSALVHTR